MRLMVFFALWSLLQCFCMLWLHWSGAVSTVTSQQDGLWFEPRLRPFSAEFACVPVPVWVSSRSP